MHIHPLRCLALHLTYALTYTHMHTHAHTYTRTHTHTLTHTCTLSHTCTLANTHQTGLYLLPLLPLLTCNAHTVPLPHTHTRIAKNVHESGPCSLTKMALLIVSQLIRVPVSNLTRFSADACACIRFSADTCACIKFEMQLSFLS